MAVPTKGFGYASSGIRHDCCSAAVVKDCSRGYLVPSKKFPSQAEGWWMKDHRLARLRPSLARVTTVTQENGVRAELSCDKVYLTERQMRSTVRTGVSRLSAECFCGDAGKRDVLAVLAAKGDVREHGSLGASTGWTDRSKPSHLRCCKGQPSYKSDVPIPVTHVRQQRLSRWCCCLLWD